MSVAAASPRNHLNLLGNFPVRAAAINADRDSTDNIVRVALNYQFH
jgi:hypothetical protein